MSMKNYFEDVGTLCFGSMMLSTNMNKGAQDKKNIRSLKGLRG